MAVEATRRAHLHIGLPKTGTTYLQSALWENKQALADHGLLLPGRNHRRHLLASLDVREVKGVSERRGDTAQPWQDLVDECRAWSGDVLLTHEFFAAASPEQVERMVADLDDHEVHVILTARSVADLFASRWQEWVKNGGRKAIDHYPPRDDYRPQDNWGWGSFDLADVLERWSSVVDPSRIHVIVVDTSEVPAALWERFAALVGADAAGVTPHGAAANTALGVVEVELLRRITPHLEEFQSSADRGNWIRGRLAEGGWMPQRSAPFRVGVEKRAVLEERSDRAIELLTTGGFDLVGDLDSLRPRDDSARRHPDDVTDTEMLASSTELVAAMLSEIRRLTQENRSLAQQADEARQGTEESAPTSTAKSGNVADRERSGRWFHRSSRR